MLNTVDWLSFLVNEKMVTDKRLVARMKPIVVRYYEDLVQNNVRLDEKKVIAYEDLEKFYQKIKKSPRTPCRPISSILHIEKMTSRRGYSSRKRIQGKS